MAVQLLVTAAGLDALVNAQASETETIQVIEVGLTASAFTLAPTLTALPGEFKRIDAISGQAVSETIIHMTAQDSSEDVYDLRGIGLYLADGTLFAVYGQASPIFRKVSIAAFLLALDIAFSDGAASDIVFGDASFLLPPATETVMGIAELATYDEVAEGVDDSRIVTPYKLARWLAHLAYAPLAAVNALVDTVNGLLGRRIMGGGLVMGGGDLGADRTLSVTAASAWDVANGIATDRAVTPAAMWPQTGAINALAPLLDRVINGGGLVTGGGNLRGDRTLTVTPADAGDVAAGTATDRAITPAALAGLARSLAVDGYAVLPGAGGLRLVWGQFTALPNGSTTVSFPVSFNTACFGVVRDGQNVGSTDAQDNPPGLVRGTITPSSFAVFSAFDNVAPSNYLAWGV
jgi:hypothetical protein